MKTQKNTNPTLPSPVKFSFYLLAVALVCFLNWNALKASDPVDGKTETLAARLEAALVPVAEEEIELEDWMLTISDEIAAESEIVLEDWMLSFDEIVLADWMLVVPDPAPAIEEWMVNTDSWFKVEFMATK